MFIEITLILALVFMLLSTSECLVCALLYKGPLSEHGQPSVRALLACWRCGGLYDQHGRQVHDLYP